MSTKINARQVISRDVLGHLLGTNGTELDDLLVAINKEFNIPLRMSASATPDAKLNFTASIVEAADQAGKSIAPLGSNLPSVTTSTIDFQTQGTTGATFIVVWPSSTVGQYRRVAFSLTSTGDIRVSFSAEQVSIGSLDNPGLLFPSGELPIGWVDLECTNASGLFKTAGSATNIIENKVGSNIRVNRVISDGSGGGGGSSFDKLMTSATDGHILVSSIDGKVYEFV